jgi:HD-like signal output (HDOD) protein
LQRLEGKPVENIRHTGHAAPSGLDRLRAEVAGLVKYRQLDVPAPSEHALRLLPLAGRPNADVRVLTRLVQSDRLVESRVLRVAQFAAYQPSTPIMSLGEAIAWLGAGEVADIAFTAAVQGKLFDTVRGAGGADQCWRVSIAAAIWAREIGAVSRCRTPLTYASTLLHDLGALCTRLAGRDISAKLGVRLSPEDEDLFVREHEPRYRDAIIRRWALPPAVVDCMQGWAAWQPGGREGLGVAVTHLAHHLAEIVTSQGPEFAREALSGNAALDVLNVSPDRFTSLLERTPWVMGQVGAY